VVVINKVDAAATADVGRMTLALRALLGDLLDAFLADPAAARPGRGERGQGGSLS
jgi:hypothetical protein